MSESKVDNLTGLVGDRYLIEHRLGEGGTSVVFAARDRLLDRAVALKVLRGAEDDEAGDRLVREARAIARLSHPNVIQVFDVGGAAGGPVYVAMELVEGVTLDRWLRERAADTATTVAAFVAAGRGLAAAHAAGLVHRDFDPTNVMVGADGRVRVLDFGLARGTGAVPVPEDARSAQRSFCVALASALGGRSDIPAGIAAVLRRGMADRADDRFATMDELVAALQPPAVARRRRPRLVWMAAAALTIAGGAVAIAIGRAPAAPSAPASAVVAPPAPVGFRCGPWLQTYAVTDRDDSQGVRCVLVARDQDGAPWIAWYGEGVRDGAPYRQVGEGRLGGDGTVVALTGNGEGAELVEGALRLGSAAPGPRPPRITVGGALDETWIRTAGTHADYATAFSEPIRMCGPQLARYRGFRTIEGFAGSSVRCRMPGGRTWLGAGAWNGRAHLHLGTTSFEDGVWAPIAADLCNHPDDPCGEVRHGDLAITPRRFPGVGDGFDLTGLWPEVWFPSTRRDALRLHVVRVVDRDAADARPAVADIERAVRRANQLLEPDGLDIHVVADEHGPDLATATDDTVASHVEQIRAAHPSRAIVLFRAGATGGCAPSTSPGAIELSLLDDVIPGCTTPWDDRLGHALADHVP